MQQKIRWFFGLISVVMSIICLSNSVQVEAASENGHTGMHLYKEETMSQASMNKIQPKSDNCGTVIRHSMNKSAMRHHLPRMNEREALVNIVAGLGLIVFTLIKRRKRIKMR
jgi:membrane protein insertase Oxa1/YidC/SpoIIIJ